MSYSPKLTPFLDRLSGFSTNYFRLEVQNQDSATANKILRFTLPSNALCHLPSFTLLFQASANGTASAGGRLPNDISSLIERVEVSCGGVQISAGHSFYNVLHSAKNILEGDKSDPKLSHPEMVREVSYVDGSTITGTNNETYSSTNKQTFFAIKNFDGFLSTCAPSILDTSLVSDVVISIFLADNNVLSSCAGVDLSGTGGGTEITDTNATKATYTMSNIHATIECMGLSGSVYNNMISGMIASQGFIELPYKQYFSFQDTVTNTMRWTVASQSIDKIIVCTRMNNYSASGGAIAVNGYKVSGAFVDDAAAETDADIDIGVSGYDIGGTMDYNKEKYVSRYLNFVEPDTLSKNTYQFQMNGAYFPQFKATFEEMMAITENSMNSKYKCNYSLDTAKNNYAVMAIRLNMPDSEAGRLISGLNTRSVSLNGYFTMDNVDTSTYTPTVNLFVETTSSLKIGAGRMMEVVQ